MLHLMKKIKVLDLNDGSQSIDIKDFSWPKKYDLISEDDVNKAVNFAIEIAKDFSKPRHKHEHGKTTRSEKEYLMDMFIGKLGEVFVKNKLDELNIKCSDIDFEIYSGFDDCDLKLEVNKKEYNISIKTSKANSRLLLLEWNKYNDKGQYLHGMSGTIKVDAFVAPVIKLNSYYIPKNIKEDEYELFLKSLNPSGFVYGYLSPSIIINCKKHNKFLKAGTKLNNNISLEVDNFAIRLDSLSPIDKLKSPKC